ncbi:Oidioi.mRNA.OKI2018_I69.PAR.g11328.t1.cds [Oikopleura dioica]|uniref:Oidioi.mRNA.OKI2018_I69.PAR.g11328.t1.cds n=1 Tax=Oikopleura dioica TaxID=34765 RepID=A0ABN7RVG8_OIKDI|nr:Oidioi.mRNA.OKI2018_I69.PAR.g11328.t1.cds [Oikopleura dioica]
MRGEKGRTKEEEDLLNCYIRLKEKKEKLRRLRQEKADKKNNQAPLVKKNFNMDRQFNEKELKNQVKNASSATERAKMLLKAGKLKVDQRKSAGFKRRQSTGAAKARPLQLDEPEFELPQYADDTVIVPSEDKYKNIPDSNAGLPQAPMKPKPRPVQKKPPTKKPQINRQQICYDDDLFD